MLVSVLGDRETVLLFALGEIEGNIVDNEEQAINRIKEIHRDKKVGLLIVTEQISLWASDIINRIRFSKDQLLIIEIPDKNGHIDTGKSLSDYIREAVGIRI